MGRQITLPEPEPRSCRQCGKVFTPRRKSPGRMYCSLECQRKTFLNSSNGNANLSRQTARKRGDALRGTGEGKGYIKRNGKHEHRVVMEEKLGRKLEPGEIVHHKDENKRNNHPDNLELLSSQGEHARIHSTKNRNCEVSGCDNKHFSKGMCNKHYTRFAKRGTTADPEPKPIRQCSEPGCTRTHYAKGLCNLHWQHSRRKGE